MLQLKVQASQLANRVSLTGQGALPGLTVGLSARTEAVGCARAWLSMCFAGPPHNCSIKPACLPRLPAPQQLVTPEEQQQLEAYKSLTSDKLRPSRDPGTCALPGLQGCPGAAAASPPGLRVCLHAALLCMRRPSLTNYASPTGLLQTASASRLWR